MKKIIIMTVLFACVNFTVEAQNKEIKYQKSNDISLDDIKFWVGEGKHKAIFVVNWCSPEMAFAWGYQFDNDSVLVQDMMNDIQHADTRFDYVDGGGYVTDITYKDATYDLKLVGDYWMYNINEGSAMGINTQYFYPTDIVEFGDESCGISDSNWIYTWNTAITPVSSPTNRISEQSNYTQSFFVSIYPNPCNDLINIDLENINESISISIFDLKGMIFYKNEMLISGNTKQTISTENLSQGIYFIRFQGKSVNKVSKIIVY